MKSGASCLYSSPLCSWEKIYVSLSHEEFDRREDQGQLCHLPKTAKEKSDGPSAHVYRGGPSSPSSTIQDVSERAEEPVVVSIYPSEFTLSGRA